MKWYLCISSCLSKLQSNVRKKDDVSHFRKKVIRIMFHINKLKRRWRWNLHVALHLWKYIYYSKLSNRCFFFKIRINKKKKKIFMNVYVKNIKKDNKTKITSGLGTIAKKKSCKGLRFAMIGILGFSVHTMSISVQ